MKKEIALAYELTSDNVDKFIENISNYKKKKFIIFNVNLTHTDIDRIKKTCDCLIVKYSRIFKPRFIIFKYLKYYKQIIFTNVNIVLDKEFFEQYKTCKFATFVYPNNRFVEANFKKIYHKYHMFETSHDTSLMVISDSITDYNKIANWCVLNSIILHSKLRNSVSGIMDLMIQKFNIDVTPIISKTDVNNSKKIKCNAQKVLNRKVSGDLVSVVMTIYNRTNTIAEAINSILNQTYKNIELIIVVEKSNKQSEISKIISNIKDDRIVLINNTKNLGLAESLNVGVKKSKGKYIARMDDDDISDYTRIEKQVKFLKQNQDIAIVGTHMQFYGNSNLICELPTDNEELKVKCLYKTPLFHPTVMFNLNKISKNDINYRNGIYAEDYDLWSRLIEKYSISNIPEILYYYSLSGNNTSTKNEKAINESHLAIMQYQLKKYLNLELTFDELQLLSGRIDVLGNSINVNRIYKMKKKILKKIIKMNIQKRFYDNTMLKKEIVELDDYYRIICNIKK